MAEENVISAYGEAPAARGLGRTLHRHRRLRIGLMQLAYVAAGVLLGLVVPRIPIGFTVPRSRDHPDAVRGGRRPAHLPRHRLLAGVPGRPVRVDHVHPALQSLLHLAEDLAQLRLHHRRARVRLRRRLQRDVRPCLRRARAARHDERPRPDRHDRPAHRGDRRLPQPADARLRLGRARLRACQVTERGRRVLEGVYADEPPRDAVGAEMQSRAPFPTGGASVVWTGRSGIIQDIDVPRIIAAARSADAAVEIVVPIGETVHHSAPVAIIHGSADPSLDAVVLQGDPDRDGAHLRAGSRRWRSASWSTSPCGPCRRRSTTRPRPSRSWTARRACCACSSAATSTSARSPGRRA